MIIDKPTADPTPPAAPEQTVPATPSTPVIFPPGVFGFYCGACNSSVAVEDSFEAKVAARDHECPNSVRSTGSSKWYEYVFSFWGLFIIIAIVYGVAVIMRAQK